MRIAFVWIALLAACGGRQKPAKLDVATIEALVGATLQDGGVSVAVLRGDEVVFARGWGDARTDTVFPLLSLSKQFWAAAIALQVERGTLDVDTPVADLLPAFPDRRITVRHLLTQTSGLDADADGEDDEAFTDLPPVAFEPGTWWHYSNRGAVLARRVLEAVAGQPWSAILADEIAGPLGLASTRTCTSGDAPFLTPATVERVQFVCADALDAARWERALDQGRLLAPATLAQMRTPVALTIDGARFELAYGWFTRIHDLGGHRAFGHTGNFEGMTVAAYTFPDDDLTIAVLQRGHSDAAWSLLAGIARLALGVPPPPSDAGPPPPELLRAIAGTYEDGGTVVEVSDHDGLAHVAIPAASWEADVWWVGGTSFLGSPDGFDSDQPATFLVAGDRAVAVTWGHVLLLDVIARRR